MSDLLTHWAVFDDTRRLAALDGSIEHLFHELMNSDPEYARLGAISRGGNRLMPAVLRDARARWPEGDPDGSLRRRIAFVLGGLTHQACDNAMKPIFTSVAGSDWDQAHHAVQDQRPGADAQYMVHNEISAYYDTHVFREVYLSGHEEPFSRFLLAGVEDEPERALEAFVRSLFQRALLSSHTLSPDPTDPIGWLDRLFAMTQELYVDVGLYVRVFQEPDEALVSRYHVTDRFYLADDPIIRVARSVHRTGSVPSGFQGEALAVDSNASGYGKALATSLAYLRNCSSFWRGETDILDTPNWAPVGSATSA